MRGWCGTAFCWCLVSPCPRTASQQREHDSGNPGHLLEGPDVEGVPVVDASNGSVMHYASLGRSVGGGGVSGGPGGPGPGDGDDMSSMGSMVTSET